MRKGIIKILICLCFMLCFFSFFAILGSAAVLAPDGATHVYSPYCEVGESDRTLIINCYDESGRLIKKYDFRLQKDHESYVYGDIYDYYPISFTSDQSLWETCKFRTESGGRMTYGTVSVRCEFKGGFSKKTMTADVVMRKFNPVKVITRQYKQYRTPDFVCNQTDYKIAYAPEKTLNIGDYYSSGTYNYNGYTFEKYVTSVSGNFTMAWIDTKKSAVELEDWDLIKAAAWIHDSHPELDEYNINEHGCLQHTENHVVTVSYYYTVNWCTYTFDANGGSGGPSSMSWWYDHKTKFPTSVPVRDGYVFLGWSTYPDVDYVNYSPGCTHTMRTDRTLYAVWDDYEFSVDNMSISAGDEIFANQTLEITAMTDSWDRDEAYENIEVALYYDDKLIEAQYYDYDVYERIWVTFYLNVGAATGEHIIDVRINWDDRGNEVNPNNNITRGKVKIRKDDYAFSIEPLPPDTPYREGTDVYTSYLVYNDAERNVYPSADVNIRFIAYYYKDGKQRIIDEQYLHELPIPSGYSNLAYFRWTVPDGLKGTAVYCECEVNYMGVLKEYDRTNNTAVITNQVIGAYSQTENPSYAASTPVGFTKAEVPDTSAGSASWTVWEYDGGFVRTNYGLSVSDSTPRVMPGSTCASAVYNGSEWVIKSGYGFYISYSPTVEDFGSYTHTSEHTGVQTVCVYLPESRYSKNAGEYRTLVSYDGTWCFEPNSGADGNANLHYIPVWFEDGEYIISVVSEMWTPVGLVTSIKNVTVVIDGSIFDNYYVGT